MADKAISACMGGWCGVRQRCEHYLRPTTDWLQPHERLCLAGQDGVLKARVVPVPKPLDPEAQRELAREQSYRWAEAFARARQ